MAAAAGKPSVKTALVLGLKIVASIALFAWLYRKVDWVNAENTIVHARLEWLGAAFLLLFTSNVGGALQWNRLLRAAGIDIPFWKVLSYYHVGLFFNNFLPANVGGDFARVLDASRASEVSRTTAFSTVLLDRMIGTVALGALAVLTTLPGLDDSHLNFRMLLGLWGGALVFFTFTCLMLWAVFHPKLLAAIEGLLGRVGLGQLKPALDELSERLAMFRGQRRMFMELFAIALGVQVMRIGVHVLVGRALGLTVPTAYFFLFVPLLAVIVSLPISFNGIGVREGAGIWLFGLVGLGQAAAFTLQFTTYLVAFAVSLIGGVVFLVRIPYRRAESRTPRRPEE
ncbi:MAG: flippase-like domain-containing protein [Candidatus Eisenbacteria bacterium]|uniref:Flippase-like domain-containing protein n=1 Tax=Eiseniibacteriota bacterium TaxID=2212470 RepID=A0A933W2F7_UNCEI|nr:flippase-like domain-containing protein [Candidatus Eisenbacteria bacterium]